MEQSANLAARPIGTYVLAVALVGGAFAGASHWLSGGGPLSPLSAADVLFYVVASVVMVAAVGVAFGRSVIGSAISLLGTLLGAGALYVFLNADYVAVTQLLIYVGGVLVLILFAVMLTQRVGDAKKSNPSIGRGPALLLWLALVGGGGFIAVATPWKRTDHILEIDATAEQLGDLLLGPYVLAFEVISLLLLATLVGAVVVARREVP